MKRQLSRSFLQEAAVKIFLRQEVHELVDEDISMIMNNLF